MLEGMRRVYVWVGWVREGMVVSKRTNHLWCCQEGETEPTWRAWGAIDKDRAQLLL